MGGEVLLVVDLRLQYEAELQIGCEATTRKSGLRKRS
jgi:hypothetical protein